MKLFIDTANVEEIKNASKLGIISGVTTNPSLLAKTGRKLDEVIEEITSLVDGPISAEVTEADADTMYNQAHDLVNEIKSDKLTIKLPMTDEGIKVCKRLSKEGIKTNVTLIFSLPQAILAMEAGATFISPFMGRMDDYYDDAEAGYRLIEEISQVKEKYSYSSKIIAASIRNVNHVKQAALANADIATIPYKVLLEMYHHPLTKSGLEKFKLDSGR